MSRVAKGLRDARRPTEDGEKPLAANRILKKGPTAESPK